ncbi:Ethylene-responsive transcription factor [Capsicum chinense]|nr:Ethylene-responsive transcription factor [Capsicum chinense]
MRGKYNYESTSPISKKRVWLDTFGTAEEASRVDHHSKKLEFDVMLSHSEQHGRSEVDASISNADNVGIDRRIDCHEIGTGEEASRVFNSCLMANVHGAESSDECNITRNCDPKDKIRLVGIRRRKSGRYFAEISDPIQHKKVYLGTFDTIEQASQAYFSKKSEFENLRKGNKDDKPKKNCDQIQQPESPSVVETLNTATSCDPKDKISGQEKLNGPQIGLFPQVVP